MTDAPITVPERITELMKQHGGLNKASSAVKVSAPYLSRLRNGHVSNPGPITLKKLGLSQRIYYVRRKPYER